MLCYSHNISSCCNAVLKCCDISLSSESHSLAISSLSGSGYPIPPNVTISKIMYNSRKRVEVDVEWAIGGAGDLTGFIVEQRRPQMPELKTNGTMSWLRVATGIEPDARTYKLVGLEPAVTYTFRILAVNRRTLGYPSEGRTPGETKVLVWCRWSETKVLVLWEQMIIIAAFLKLVLGNNRTGSKNVDWLAGNWGEAKMWTIWGHWEILCYRA